MSENQKPLKPEGMLEESELFTAVIHYPIQKVFRITDLKAKPNAVDDTISNSYKRLLQDLLKSKCPTHNLSASSCDMGKSLNRVFVDYYLSDCCCDDLINAVFTDNPYCQLSLKTKIPRKR